MDGCIFCKIVNGEIPSETVFENNEFKVILDAFPANKGHVLVITKEHSANVFKIDRELAARAFLLAVDVARAVGGLDFAEGVNILQNNDEAAGQTVFHFHIHVIPRFKSDAVSMKWKTESYESGEASKYGDILRGLFATKN